MWTKLCEINGSVTATTNAFNMSFSSDIDWHFLSVRQNLHQCVCLSTIFTKFHIVWLIMSIFSVFSQWKSGICTNWEQGLVLLLSLMVVSHSVFWLHIFLTHAKEHFWTWTLCGSLIMGEAGLWFRFALYAFTAVSNSSHKSICFYLYTMANMCCFNQGHVVIQYRAR